MTMGQESSSGARPRVLVSALRLTDGPDRRKSGNYYHVLQLVTAMAQLPDVDLAALADEESSEDLEAVLTPARVVRVSLRNNVLKRDFATAAAVRRLRPDIFHRPTGALPTFPLPCLTIAGIADLNFATLPTRLDRRVYKELTHRWTSRVADRIVCVSEYTKRRVLDYLGAAADRVAVVHHGTNVLTGTDDGTGERIRRNVGPYWLTFGHHAHKNVETLLLAADAARRRGGEPLRLVVVGEGPYVDEVLSPMAAALGLDTGVVFAGKVSSGTLRGLYERSNGLLFPSLYEGFGLPLLEAMANDCPVICSDRCSLPEVGGDAVMLTPATDVNAILAAVEAMRVRRGEMVRRGRLRVRAFTWEKAATDTVALYRTLASRRRHADTRSLARSAA